MLKPFLILLSLCVLLESCSKDEYFATETQQSTHSVKAFLRFETGDTSQVDYLSQSLTLSVKSNVKYELSIHTEGDVWVEGTVQRYSHKFKSEDVVLNIEANLTDAPRSAEIVISTKDRQISDTLILWQKQKDVGSLSDGDVVIFQMSSVGNANVVIMGDGFKAEHIQNGYYEKTLRQAAEHFFSIEPFATYQEYFNVYMVAAESETDDFGGGGLLGSYLKKTKFRTSFGSGTEINCDEETVFKYVEKISYLQNDSPVLCILVLNVDRYAGTCYMYLDGSAIAMCPMCTLGSNSGFDAMIRHEAGGHGFGFFADEYIYYLKTMPQSYISDIKQWQGYGYQMNLDFVGNPQDVHWNSFIGLEGYDGVGVYEGGQEYAYGVWRSEENSCMNDNIPYYSTYCRWLIYDRIMRLSGKEGSMEDFLENDHVSEPSSLYTKGSLPHFVPTSPPVLKSYSLRAKKAI